MKYQLYNNTIELDFNEEKHLYTVDNKKVDGTTSALGIINKPALMYWAVNQAVAFFQNAIKPGVIYDEIQLKAMAEGMKFSHRKKSGDAMDIGKIVHDWIEKYIAGKNPSPIVNQQAKNSINKFLEWEKTNNVEFIESERIVYSKEYGYAGTLDFVAEMDGLDSNRVIVLGDFKTSSGIWDEYWFQLAAYQQAYLEENPTKNISGSVIVRIGKDATLEVKHSKAEDYEANKDAFNSALIIHRRITTLKDEAYKAKQVKQS